MNLPRALIIREKENFISHNGPAGRGSELILNECAASGREIIAGVEVGVAQKVEHIPMKSIGSGFRDDVDLASGIFTKLRVEVRGEDSEFGDGIEIGNDRRGHASSLFGICAINHEAVGGLPLAIDGKRSGVQIAGRRKDALA